MEYLPLHTTPYIYMVYGRYNELVNGVYKPTYNCSYIIGFIIDLYDLYGAFLKWGYPKIAGLFHGKSQSKMNDLAVPLFQETTIYLCVNMHGISPVTYKLSSGNQTWQWKIHH
jgi:uncharacterized oligopeptide transporter (OPT) family protein